MYVHASHFSVDYLTCPGFHRGDISMYVHASHFSLDFDNTGHVFNPKNTFCLIEDHVA